MAHHNFCDKKPAKQTTVFIGQEAEKDACDFLEKHGLTLVEKNYISYGANGKKSGEIDLIMRDDFYYVFVEVKKRHYDDFGNPLEVISQAKKARIIRAATVFLFNKALLNEAYCRFDVVGISHDRETVKKPIMTWIKNAFQVQY